MPDKKVDVLVLVVEDNHDYALTIDMLLSQGVGDGKYAIKPFFDYRVTHVDRFDDAKKKMRENEYDIIILDIHLPNGAGTELVRETRELAPRDRTAIIVTTGYTDDEEEVKARQALANDYLDKLSTTDIELFRTIRNCAIWAVGCREVKEKMAGMDRVGKRMDDTIRTRETTAIVPKVKG